MAPRGIALAALVALSAVTATASASDVTTADVLVQAGHQGRPDCNVEPPSLCRDTGASKSPGEIVWTPIVADEATRILEAHGVSVLRMPAYLPRHYNVGVAVFIHFDAVPDPDRPCKAHSSVGYPPGEASKALAQAWKALYGATGTTVLHPTTTPPISAVLRLSPRDRLKGRIPHRGWRDDVSCGLRLAAFASQISRELVAYFVSRQIGKGNVPLPASNRRPSRETRSRSLRVQAMRGNPPAAVNLTAGRTS